LRNALAAVATLALLGVFVAASARAEETYVGSIIVTDGGSGANAVHNLLPSDGGAFYLAPNSLLTVQPNAAACVCVDQLAVSGAFRMPTCACTGAGKGVKLAADTAFPTSCAPGTNVMMPDGGQRACTVACVPASGASVTCDVYYRRGNDM
jgi:hypothetical protein